MEVAAVTTLWHRRPGHLNRKNPNLLKTADNDGVSFNWIVRDCDVCTLGEEPPC